MQPITAHASGRRTVLGGSIALGAAATLTACGGSAGPQDVPEATGRAARAAATKDLPVGGSVAVTVEGKDYLLWRQDESTVLAYSAVCTHQGCRVGLGTDDFKCPCHGSEFSHEDGSRVAGPAKKPLTRVAAQIDGSEVMIYL